MKTLKAQGGRSVALRLDPATFARLDYLAAYFLAAHGLQVGQSVLVRRAVSALCDEVSKAVLRARKNGSEDKHTLLAGVRVRWDARENGPPLSWRNGPPAWGELSSFPTFKGAEAARVRAAPAPIPPPFNPESEDVTT